ncbi:hypothetical protein C0991_000090 [Blastosporella zonata]|nr:hypothetical protein C0991_000090 [Blastosporella zonata]
MDESLIPSLSAGVVGSRFITESDLDTAKARRDEQWKAAYARLGQEPPPQQQEDSYDGRSLAEQLDSFSCYPEDRETRRMGRKDETRQVMRSTKLSTWLTLFPVANQFRALEEDEIMFLDSIRERQEAEERLRKEQDGVEVKSFKEAIAARTSASNNPPPAIGALASATAPKAPTVAPVGRKDAKKSLKGVVVKRKHKATTTPAKTQEVPSASKPTQEADTAEAEPPNAKRQRMSAT